MTFGEKIVSLRKQKGLSQDQLAELLGVSRQSVSKWERDEAFADTEKVLALSRIFGVSCDYLLKGEEAAPTPPAGGSALLHRMWHWCALHWYWAGLVLALWGVLNLVQLGLGYLTMRSVLELPGTISGWESTGGSQGAENWFGDWNADLPWGESEGGAGSDLSSAMLGRVMLVGALSGLAKIALGLFLFFWGRKRVRAKQTQETMPL